MFITEICEEDFPDFSLPRPNVQCPNISQILLSLSSNSSCFQFNQTLKKRSLLEYCFKEINQVLKKPKFTNINGKSKDRCFVYVCLNLTENEDDFNLCISEYMAKEFLTRKYLNIPQPYLTVCQEEDVEDCIDEFIEICLKKQGENRFIQTCLNLLFDLCRHKSQQNRTKCKDFIENRIDDNTEKICKSTSSDVVCVS